jgi:polyferredoxin
MVMLQNIDILQLWVFQSFKKKVGNKMEKSAKNSKIKKIQWARTITQFVFMGLLIGGIYMNIRMVLMILLPASLLFGNFFCAWACPYGTVQEWMGKTKRNR